MAYRLAKYLISIGRTDNMADKLGALMLGGSITDEQYTELVALLPESTEA